MFIMHVCHYTYIESIRPGYIAAVCSTIVIMIVLCGYLVVCAVMVTSKQFYTHILQLHSIVFTTESCQLHLCSFILDDSHQTGRKFESETESLAEDPISSTDHNIKVVITSKLIVVV